MSVSIMIYVHDDNDLSWYLDRLADMGFADFDWCEMRAPARWRDRVTYGPCESLPAPIEGE